MGSYGLTPLLKKNDKKASVLIIAVSLIVFAAVVILSKVRFSSPWPFNVHYFATFNACINSCVAFLLLAGLHTARRKRYLIHQKIMMTAIVLSVLFLVSYILHHLYAGDTKFGDLNGDGLLNEEEKVTVGSIRYVYYILLLTHIPLAGIILPFILFTAYRALTGEYAKHKKLTRFTWPLWFYVALSGVIIYLMISPYYT